VTVIDYTVVSLFGFLYCIVVLMLWRTYCLHLQGDWISSGGCWYCTVEENVRVLYDRLKEFDHSQL